MKILLFGGHGFIGEYLARQLRARAERSIVVIDRDTPPTTKDFDVDVIVVLTQPGLVQSILLPAIVSAKRLKKILYCSSLLVYPDSLSPQSEDVEPKPQTEYETGKHNEELLLSDFAREKDIALCIARLANVYGDIKNRGIINPMLLSIIKGDKLMIFGDKDKKVRDYIFIEDVVKFLEFLIFYSQQNKKEIFNICTGIGHSVAELIGALEVVSGKKIHYNVGESVLEKQSIVGENKKILGLSGYALDYDLASGLRKTYRNYTAFYLSKP